MALLKNRYLQKRNGNETETVSVTGTGDQIDATVELLQSHPVVDIARIRFDLTIEPNEVRQTIDDRQRSDLHTVYFVLWDFE